MARRYAVWRSALGAHHRTSGDTADGSATRSTRTAGYMRGFGQLLGAQSLLGGAIAMGESNATLSGGLGTSRGNCGQFGLHDSTRLGSVTLAAAAAATDMNPVGNRTLYFLGEDRQRGDGLALAVGEDVEQARKPLRQVPKRSARVVRLHHLAPKFGRPGEPLSALSRGAPPP